MDKTTAALALTVWSMLGCAEVSSRFTPPPVSNEPAPHVEVYFSQAGVQPETAQLVAGGEVIWMHTSTVQKGSVFFPKNMRGSFTCSEMPPSFMKTGLGYRSIPISGGTESVALPCPLEPGEYAYEIWLYGSAAGMGVPESKIPARIVVVEPPPEDADDDAGDAPPDEEKPAE